MSEDLVTVAKFGNSQEASMARAMLESHGISGLTVGGEINNALWHLGSTIAGVELKVPESEARRATEILESHLDEESIPGHNDWICPECGAEVDADFDVCWSCGAAFTPPESEPDPTPPDVGVLPEGLELVPEEKIFSPSVFQDVIPEGEQMAGRALKAAAWGIIFFPVLAYAVYLLAELSTRELSKPALKQYYQATLIVLLMSVFWFCLVFAW